MRVSTAIYKLSEFTDHQIYVTWMPPDPYSLAAWNFYIGRRSGHIGRGYSVAAAFKDARKTLIDSARQSKAET